MRAGWSLKDAASILGIHPNRVTQSLDPTLHRIALLWKADATRTMAAILNAVDNLDPMREAEMDLLERMHSGRIDRGELHPNACSVRRTPCTAARSPRFSTNTLTPSPH